MIGRKDTAPYKNFEKKDDVKQFHSSFLHILFHILFHHTRHFPRARGLFRMRGVVFVACALALARATLVQELRFVSDAKAMIEKEGGDVIMIGLFGDDQEHELQVFTTVAHSREFGDTGWVVGWSREERVRRHFEVDDDDTPRVLLYRDFDSVGDILEGGARDVIRCARARAGALLASLRRRARAARGARRYRPEEWKAGGDDTAWDYLSLKRFIWGSSYPPIVRHPIQPDPRDPSFDEDEDEDDDDDETSLDDADKEEKLVADIIAMRARRAATSTRSQAALQQQTVPKFVVLMHRPKCARDISRRGRRFLSPLAPPPVPHSTRARAHPQRYFEEHTDEGDALLSFSKRQKGRILVVQMDVDDNPAAEPIASMLGLTLDEARAAVPVPSASSNLSLARLEFPATGQGWRRRGAPHRSVDGQNGRHAV